MIDAQFRSEEKYLKLSLAYEKEEKEKVSSCVEKIIKKYDTKPETYISCNSKGKEILIIEYNEDTNRDAGKIFEEIISSLNITQCQ